LANAIKTGPAADAFGVCYISENFDVIEDQREIIT
jgi:hypothetical protein